MKNDFLDIVKITYFTPENAKFYRTPGGFAGLNAFLPKVGADDLKEQEDGECIWQDLGRVFFHRAFPYELPDEFISVLDKDSKEFGIIRRLSDFDDGSAAIISAELARKYFAPHITKVHSVKERFGYSYWEVESDRGRSPLRCTTPSATSPRSPKAASFLPMSTATVTKSTTCSRSTEKATAKSNCISEKRGGA